MAKMYVITVTSDWAKPKTFRTKLPDGNQSGEKRDHWVRSDDLPPIPDPKHPEQYITYEGLSISRAADKPAYTPGTKLAIQLKTKLVRDDTGANEEIITYTASNGSVWVSAKDVSYEYTQKTGDRSVGQRASSAPASAPGAPNGHARVNDQPMGSAVEHLAKKLYLAGRAYLTAVPMYEQMGMDSSVAHALSAQVAGPSATSTILEVQRGTLEWDFAPLGYKDAPAEDDPLPEGDEEGIGI